MRVIENARNAKILSVLVKIYHYGVAAIKNLYIYGKKADYKTL
jgi:hypothetical protein